MPNLLHEAQQTQYGQLVTNFAHHHQQQIYISSDFTKKKYYGGKNIFYSEIIPLITYNECSFFPRWRHECDYWKYNDEFAWQKNI